MSAAARARVLLAAAAAVGFAGCSAGALDAVDLDPHSLGNGLVAHWTFDDVAAGALHDRSGNTHDGTIAEGTPVAAGQFGGALHFDGAVADSGINVPMFPQPSVSWSVAGWVRTHGAVDTGDSYQTIISTELLQIGGWQLNLRINTTNPSLSAYQFAYWVGPGDSDYIYKDCTCVILDQWVHVAGVVDRDAGLLSVYRNGVFQVSAPAPSQILMGDNTLHFGRWTPNNPDDKRLLQGDLDDFAVYNRALVPLEIERLAHEVVPDPN